MRSHSIHPLAPFYECPRFGGIVHVATASCFDSYAEQAGQYERCEFPVNHNDTSLDAWWVGTLNMCNEAH